MNLTYEVTERGYTIFRDGVPWIKQDSYIPYPAETLAESAQLHIDSILASQNLEPAPSLEDEVKQLKQENQLLQQSLLELTSYAATQDERLATQEQALLELSTVLAGGGE
ncbi:hypothetical protein [Robertmurraya siralis]|uniref:hypothetical protein n=1 Tax=Robertmurraya siralis TaxID=77777 RepID=UPI0010F4821F|nr:hypothetical protein [Robertmurraya siralis]